MMPTDSASLTPFFNPSGIAVIGASQDPTKLGYGLARNLVLSNYQGAIHFVNPHHGALFGLPIYPSIADVPDPVDLVIVLIPAPAIPQALRQTGQRGVKAAIIGAGGFRETGSEGARLEEECLQIAKEFGMRLMGPNSIGYLDTHLPIDATFLPPPGPLHGDIAFVSHSGAICAAVIDWARGHSFGLSRLVSLGNQADVNETDVLALVAADRFTRVLTLYLEGVRDGQRFVAEASRITRQKPVIALKVGRFSSGQRAVASHTGALAGSDNAFNAAFRRAGVIRAETSQEMFDWARALAWCPPPAGRNVAILTNAGGPGVTAADAVEVNGLNLLELNQPTQAALARILPSAASCVNPVDMLASASPEQYAACLKLLLADPQIHSVLVILPPPPMYTAGAVAKSLIPVIHTSQKPVVIALMGERLIQEAVEHFRAARIPEYRFPEQAASALATLARRAEYLNRPPTSSQVNLPVPQVKRDQAQKLLDQAAPGLLPPPTVQSLLECYGIPAPAFGLAHSPEQAAELASQIGFPVALKIVSPDIPHKTDVNGIVLNLHNPAETNLGYRSLLENIQLRVPGAAIQGILVQKMVTNGQDVIIGAIQDPQFGPLVMFGSGGSEVEGIKDVNFALAPLGSAEAKEIIDSTWAGRKLLGYRSLPSADLDAALDTLCRLAQMAADFPQLSEIEVNPLRVLLPGKGVLALDGRAVMSSTRA